ncbi:hypothetical protein N8494_00445 [bacterium]|jgi:hypothetical protein|nr:hypothetical protein [bacterium]MDA7510320.1 hypothetical protein [Verrucomicrobiota bacterium]MDA7633568.1 hypothetical protein [bacterium]MDA7657985.1 hypothetical protein [Verrucomicrobiota bacterium]
MLSFQGSTPRYVQSERGEGVLIKTLVSEMMKRTRLLVGIASVVAVMAVSADHHEESVAGVWYGTGVGPNGEESESTLTITEKEGKLSASSKSDQGDSRDLDRITFKDSKLAGEIDFDQDGQEGVLGVKAGLNKKGELKGKWYANDADGNELYTGDWTGLRALDKVVVGEWNVVAITDDGDLEHQISIAKSGYKYSGSITSDQGSIEIEKITVKKNKLSYEFPFGEARVKVAATLMGAKKLSGAWTYFDDSDQEAGTGKWSAKK